MILISTMILKVSTPNTAELDCASQTANKAINNPIIAPDVSKARVTPNAKPRFSSLTESAIKASRGAVRIPLPTRSAQRTAATMPQVLAK